MDENATIDLLDIALNRRHNFELNSEALVDLARDIQERYPREAACINILVAQGIASCVLYGLGDVRGKLSENELERRLALVPLTFDAKRWGVQAIWLIRELVINRSKYIPFPADLTDSARLRNWGFRALIGTECPQAWFFGRHLLSIANRGGDEAARLILKNAFPQDALDDAKEHMRCVKWWRWFLDERCNFYCELTLPDSSSDDPLGSAEYWTPQEASLSQGSRYTLPVVLIKREAHVIDCLLTWIVKAYRAGSGEAAMAASDLAYMDSLFTDPPADEMLAVMCKKGDRDVIRYVVELIQDGWEESSQEPGLSLVLDWFKESLLARKARSR